MSDQNIATVRRFWSSIKNKDVDGYLSTFAEDGIAYDPADKPPLRSTEERRNFMEGLLAAFAELDAKIDFITPCGNCTAAKWTVNGRTPGGEDVHLEGIDIYEHDADGRVKEMRGYFQM